MNYSYLNRLLKNNHNILTSNNYVKKYIDNIVIEIYENKENKEKNEYEKRLFNNYEQKLYETDKSFLIFVESIISCCYLGFDYRIFVDDYIHEETKSIYDYHMFDIPLDNDNISKELNSDEANRIVKGFELYIDNCLFIVNFDNDNTYISPNFCLSLAKYMEYFKKYLKIRNMENYETVIILHIKNVIENLKKKDNKIRFVFFNYRNVNTYLLQMFPFINEIIDIDDNRIIDIYDDNLFSGAIRIKCNTKNENKQIDFVIYKTLDIDTKEYIQNYLNTFIDNYCIHFSNIENMITCSQFTKCAGLFLYILRENRYNIEKTKKDYKKYISELIFHNPLIKRSILEDINIDNINSITEREKKLLRDINIDNLQYVLVYRTKLNDKLEDDTRSAYLKEVSELTKHYNEKRMNIEKECENKYRENIEFLNTASEQEKEKRFEKINERFNDICLVYLPLFYKTAIDNIIYDDELREYYLTLITDEYRITTDNAIKLNRIHDIETHIDELFITKDKTTKNIILTDISNEYKINENELSKITENELQNINKNEGKLNVIRFILNKIDKNIKIYDYKMLTKLHKYNINIYKSYYDANDYDKFNENKLSSMFDDRINYHKIVINELENEIIYLNHIYNDISNNITKNDYEILKTIVNDLQEYEIKLNEKYVNKLNEIEKDTSYSFTKIDKLKYYTKIVFDSLRFTENIKTVIEKLNEIITILEKDSSICLIDTSTNSFKNDRQFTKSEKIVYDLLIVILSNISVEIDNKLKESHKYIEELSKIENERDELVKIYIEYTKIRKEHDIYNKEMKLENDKKSQNYYEIMLVNKKIALDEIDKEYRAENEALLNKYLLD